MTNIEAEKPSPIEIPTSNLSEEALRGVIDSFIFREGTDYGFAELSHEEKMKSIRRQLERREIVLVFDQSCESLTFMKIQEWKKTCSKR